MGFMAGFGTEFARQIEMGQERRAQQKADAFKLKYADYISQRDTFAELKREDAKAVKRAEAIAERTGVDRKAIPWIAAQIKGGADDSTIETSVITGKFDFSQQGGKPKVEMDRQMVDSGMAPAETPEVPEAPQAPQPASNTELLHANPKNPATKVKLSDKLRELGSGIEQRRQQRLDEYSTNEVAANAGVSPEEVQSTLDGSGYESSIDTDTSGIKFTPGAPEREPSKFDTITEAQVNYDAAIASGDEQWITEATRILRSVEKGTTKTAEREALKNGIKNGGLSNIYVNGKYVKTTQVQQDADGNPVDISGNPIEGAVIPVDPIQTQRLAEINKTIDKPLQEIASAKAGVKSSLRVYSIMDDLVKKSNGDVLQPMTSGFFRWTDATVHDIAAGAAKVSQIFKDTGTLEGQDIPSLAELKNAETTLQSSGVSDLAQQKALFEVQRAIFAYQLGASLGQEGRNVSEGERKVFFDISSPGQPETFHKNMSNLILTTAKTLDDKEAQILSSDRGIKQFFADYEFIPSQYEPTSLVEELANSKDPDVKAAYQNLVNYGNNDLMPDPTKNVEGGFIPPGWDEDLWGVLTPEEQQKVRSKYSKQKPETGW
jgi:hypothetical protein